MKRATGAEPRATPERTLIANRARFLDFLERKTGDRATAEDLLQAAYARVLERGAPSIGDDGIVPWFLSVLRHAWIDTLRSRASANRAIERATSDAEALADADSRNAVCACVGDAVEALRPEYARILREVDLAQASPSQVARRSGLTPANARVRLHRARSALRAQLGRLCGACAVHGCLDCHCKGAGTRARPGASPSAG